MDSTAPSVVRPSAAHFVSCPESEYEAELAAKVARLRSLLEGASAAASYGGGFPSVDVFESPRSHFRMRANFNILRDKPPAPPDFFYAMFDSTVEGKFKPACEITSFPRGTVFLNVLMDRVMSTLKRPELSDLTTSLFEARFVCTQTEQAVIVLIYRKPLPPTWAGLAAQALELINPDGVKHVVKLVGRSHKVKLTVGGEDDVIEERYTVTQRAQTRQIYLYQTEGAFSQPNAAVCEKMLSWVCNITDDEAWRARDLLELYCGGGTFTAALCDNFRTVLATEMNKESVRLAERCFTKNAKTNVKVARMSSEEFETAMSGTRAGGGEFKRLADKGIDLKKDYDFSTVFVDPPRAGLDLATCKLLCTFDHILYISCNPETLARDVQAILQTGRYSLERVAAFDQFPYTHHLESGVYLRARASSGAVGEEEEKVGSKRKATVEEG